MFFSRICSSTKNFFASFSTYPSTLILKTATRCKEKWTHGPEGP
jgi:hypothetical protein